jgi:hypothetical protein
LAYCVLDSQIEPEHAGPPEGVSRDDWVIDRLMAECGLSRAVAEQILD